MDCVSELDTLYFFAYELINKTNNPETRISAVSIICGKNWRVSIGQSTDPPFSVVKKIVSSMRVMES